MRKGYKYIFRPRRAARLAFGAAIGLVLGWLAAGYLPGPASYAGAAEPRHDTHHAATEGISGASPAHAAAPGPEVARWYVPAMSAAAGMFVAAVLVGIGMPRRTEAPAASDDRAH